MRLRLLDRLHDHARRAPTSPAVREVGQHLGDGPREVSYAALAAAVDALAARLTTEVPPGGVVLLGCPNQAEFTAAFLACLSAGVKVFPVSPDLTGPELSAAAAGGSSAAAAIGTDAVLAALGGQVRCRLPLASVFGSPGGVSNSRPLRSHEGSGLLLQSSGTTARPKLVFRDGRSLDAVSEAMVDSIGFRPDDRVLAVVPLCHSYGMEHGLLCPVWSGACAHLCRGFDLRTARRELTESGVSVLPGVPFMFEMLAHHGGTEPFGALRRAYSAGGPLPRGVSNAFTRRFGLKVAQLYGATEIGSVTFADPDDEQTFDPDSVGRPMKGVSVRVLDVDHPRPDHPLPPGAQGQVAVKADSMFSGYVGDDAGASPTLDGYFLTGDLGRLDAHGNLTVTGRLKLLIDVGGLKVNPVEVEDVLLQHPDVAACVVVPMRVSETVCRLKAIVLPRDPDAPPAPEVLRTLARSRLIAYKVPRLFEVRQSLPKSPTGKILRHLVEA